MFQMIISLGLTVLAVIGALASDPDAKTLQNVQDLEAEASALPEPAALAAPERSIYDSGYTQTANFIMNTALKLPPHILPTLEELDADQNKLSNRADNRALVGVYVPETDRNVGIYLQVPNPESSEETVKKPNRPRGRNRRRKRRKIRKNPTTATPLPPSPSQRPVLRRPLPPRRRIPPPRPRRPSPTPSTGLIGRLKSIGKSLRQKTLKPRPRPKAVKAKQFRPPPGTPAPTRPPPIVNGPMYFDLEGGQGWMFTPLTNSLPQSKRRTKNIRPPPRLPAKARTPRPPLLRRPPLPHPTTPRPFPSTDQALLWGQTKTRRRAVSLLSSLQGLKTTRTAHILSSRQTLNFLESHWPRRDSKHRKSKAAVRIWRWLLRATDRK